MRYPDSRDGVSTTVRFGGGWIDRTSGSQPLFGLAVVRPTSEDVDVISSVARAGGWRIEIDVAKYSRHVGRLVRASSTAISIRRSVPSRCSGIRVRSELLDLVLT
jgi:uncharacterized phosphosugar-binding protein